MKETPPYFEWALDGWKLLVLVILFLLLLLGALWWPEGVSAVTLIYNTPKLVQIDIYCKTE